MSWGARIRWLTATLAAVLFTLAAVAGPTTESQIIVPVHTVKSAAPAGGGDGSGLLTAVAVLVLAGAGGWLLWHRRSGLGVSRAPRQLAIDETRSLGNRQYLVVASYRDKKYLLGVCPGRIDLLAPLQESGAAEEPHP